MAQDNKCKVTVCQEPHDNCKHKDTGFLYCKYHAAKINHQNNQTLVIIPDISTPICEANN